MAVSSVGVFKKISFSSNSPPPNSSLNSDSGGTAEGDLSRTVDQSYYCLAADASPLREMAYRLRYQVYCIENEFEDPADNPGGLEIDAFDFHSTHKLLVHGESGLVAGVVRLILPSGKRDATPFPFDQMLAPMEVPRDILPLSSTAEISRFAVSRQFRMAFSSENGGTLRQKNQMMGNISLGLMRALVQMASENGITHLCAVMEPALLRMLSRLGIHFEPLGPSVDYHGVRQPCYTGTEQLLERTWAERPDIWRLLTRDGTSWPARSTVRRNLFSTAAEF
jgi:N-acyl amino acid synthase of PEP-CTERM/exosortase system